MSKSDNIQHDVYRKFVVKKLDIKFKKGILPKRIWYYNVVSRSNSFDNHV